MSVATSDSAAVRAEKAFGEYFRGSRPAGLDDATTDPDTIDLDSTVTGLTGIPVHEGRFTGNKISPAVVVSAGESRQLWPGEDFYEVPVKIMLFTNRNEDSASTEQPEVLHQARSQVIDEKLRTEDDMKTAMNEGDPDTRDVDEFTIHAAYLDENYGEQQNDMLVETWVVMLQCSPWDAV